MPASRELRSSPDAPRRRPRWHWLVALVLLAIGAGVAWSVLMRQGSHATVGDRNTPMPAAPVPRDESQVHPLPRQRDTPTRPRSAAPPPATVTAAAAPPPPPPAADVAKAPVATLPPAPTGIVRPQYGSGQIWVRPLPVSPEELTEALTGRTVKQVDDSIVTKIVQTYLDEMATENRLHPQGAPSWTTRIGGKTVGLDQKWIYLGPIKVPTALLALLPIKMRSANISEYEFDKQLEQMRSDLYEAARRTANYQDFKEAVKELRAQTQHDRDFLKAQHTAPDSG
ncbi:MAG TPA: hypothetical protein VHW65_03955 [Gemmatimonadales bacterium]|jgi:hypothetical protein|nr:hypothetical protein [Gemmatimonadales bacterium]